MSASLGQLIPELQPFARDLVDAAGAAGLQPRVTSTRRSYSEQRRLYSRYLAGISGYPVAPPGHSAHEYGWAFDMVVSPMSALSDVGDYWEQKGGVWGGHYGDEVNFEYPGFKAALGSDINAAQALDDANPSTAGDLALSVAGALIVPTKISAGLTVAQLLSRFQKAHPWIDTSLLFAGIPGFENLLEYTVDYLPKWAQDLLTF